VGVGAAKAQAIIRYRDEVGPFRSVEELEEVKGIGSSIVKRNKARISVSNPKG
jgi:competence protein ComEA